jgi:alpha-glucoside transport system substrate-binding protein
MPHSKTFRLLWILLALIAVTALAFAACGDDDEDGDGVTPADGETPAPSALGDVDVLGIWGGAELESFEALVAPWEASTGGKLDFFGQRGIGAAITIGVEAGRPPDVAIPAEVGLFQGFAKNGDLTPLSECAGLEEKIKANYPQAFIDLGTVDGTLYAFFMKADGKGTIWYNPGFFQENGYEPLTADATFDDLLDLSQQIADGGTTPWSIGVESGADSGWPGTDWIQAILLNQVTGGAEVNDGLIDGSIPFTDDRSKEAWEKFGEIALPEANTVQGGATGINATGFLDAIFPPFQDPPTAALHHQAGFAAGEITGQFPDAVAGENYDFFPWPGGAVIGSANIVYAFNSDETTCSFLDHLASAEAQEIWVNRGGFTSVHTGVSLDAYPDAVTRAAAERLTTAEVFRFDLDDAIGQPLQGVFFTGVTEYLADPGSLDTILAAIEAARETEE